ncbi:MAG: UrcA family protein [Sphingobium sp.]
MKRPIALFAVAGALSLAPAYAQSHDFVARSEAVSYGDLDLGQPAGQRMLDRRLRSAVQAACGEASNADLASGNRVRSCRRDLTQRIAEIRQKIIAGAEARPAVTLAANPSR